MQIKKCQSDHNSIIKYLLLYIVYRIVENIQFLNLISNTLLTYFIYFSCIKISGLVIIIIIISLLYYFGNCNIVIERYIFSYATNYILLLRKLIFLNIFTLITKHNFLWKGSPILIHKCKLLVNYLLYKEDVQAGIKWFQRRHNMV